MSDQNALEWFPWYWKRWQRSRRVLRLTIAQRGLYRELLDECWRVGHIPTDPEALADLLFADPKEVAALWPSVRPFFEFRPDGNLYNAELAEIRKKQVAKYAASVKNGQKGGRPKKPSKNPAVTQPKSIRVETTLTATAAGPARFQGGGGLPTTVGEVVGKIVPPTAAQREEFAAVKAALRS